LHLIQSHTLRALYANEDFAPNLQEQDLDLNLQQQAIHEFFAFAVNFFLRCLGKILLLVGVVEKFEVVARVTEHAEEVR